MDTESRLLAQEQLAIECGDNAALAESQALRGQIAAAREIAAAAKQLVERWEAGGLTTEQRLAQLIELDRSVVDLRIALLAQSTDEAEQAVDGGAL